MVSTTVGPAGSTRFSTRRCGRPLDHVVDRAGSSGRWCRCAAAARPARACRRGPGSRPGPRRRRSAAAPGSSGRSPRTGRRPTVIQRSPNHTRGRTPCALISSDRVSVACSNSGMRVSRHSSRPNRNGELAPSATWTPAMTWAAFQYAANCAGLTCRWNWVLVQAASGAIVSVVTASRSTPSMRMSRSSPRAAKICSLSSAYRGLADSASAVRCSRRSVGRMPIMTMCAPTARACSSAAFRLARTLRLEIGVLARRPAGAAAR